MSLTITITPLLAHHKLSSNGKAAIMSSLNWSEYPTVLSMARFLATTEVPISSYYEAIIEDDDRVKKIMEYVFPHHDLHKYFLPTVFLLKNRALLRAVRKKIDEYQPGVILFEGLRQQMFDEPELKKIVAHAIESPELLGDFTVGRLAWKLNIPNGWELDCSTGMATFKEKWRQGHDIDLLIMANLDLFKKPISDLPFSAAISSKTSAALLDFLTEDSWTRGFEYLLTILIQKMQNSCKSRLALWHGRLLLGAISVYSKHSDHLQQLFLEYFSKYPIQDIPPYIAGRIIEQFREAKRFHFPPSVLLNQDQCQLLAMLEDHFSAGEGFWGSLEQYSRRFVLALQGSRIMDPPTTYCNLNEAVEFFAEGRLTINDRVLYDLTFLRPVLLRQQDGLQHECVEIGCVLNVMTQMIFMESSAFTQTPDGLIINDESLLSKNESFWICAARLIIYNIIYSGQIGVPLSKDFWKEIYEGTALIRTMFEGKMVRKSIRAINSQLQALFFISFFPLEIIIANRPVEQDL